MAINISFGGGSITTPGSFSTVDTQGMTPITLGAFNVLAFVGVPASGSTLPAGTVSYFNDPALASDAIGASELLDCLNIAWTHGADLIAVSPVGVTAPATSPADADWQKAIDLLQYEEVNGIVGVTSQASVQTKIQTHVDNMSSVVNRKERRAWYGHATGLTVTAITALQATLSDERGQMATPGVYTYDATGNKVLKPSYYLASAYAGLWAGQNPQEPITFKYVKGFAGLEKTYLGADITALLAGGIAPTVYVKNKGYRIVQGVTLSTSPDLTKSELSVSTLKDVMSRNIRDYFEEKYVGHAGVPGIEITIYNDLISMLEGFVKNQWITGYVKDSVSVTKNGTAFSLGWQGSPTLPINNFLITSHFTL